MNFKILFGLIFLVIGAALLLAAINQRKKAKAAQAWPTTAGVVLTSGLHEYQHYDSEDEHMDVNYEPQVIYQYSALGKSYQGNHISIGNISYDYGTASRIIAEYPQGSAVTVHYDPADPSSSVLETRAAGGILSFILGFVFLLIGLAVLLFTLPA